MRGGKYPVRDWAWSLGGQAEDFAIGTIDSSTLKTLNEVHLEDEGGWQIYDNTFRLVPVQHEYIIQIVGMNTENHNYAISFSGDKNDSATRFVAMLVAFGNAYYYGELSEEPNFSEICLALWFAGTNWVITYSWDNCKTARRAIEQGAGGNMKITMSIEDYNNVVLNSHRLKNTVWKNYTVKQMIGHYGNCIINHNTGIQYGERLKPYRIFIPNYRDYGIINHSRLLPEESQQVQA